MLFFDVIVVLGHAYFYFSKKVPTLYVVQYTYKEVIWYVWVFANIKGLLCATMQIRHMETCIFYVNNIRSNQKTGK